MTNESYLHRHVHVNYICEFFKRTKLIEQKNGGGRSVIFSRFRVCRHRVGHCYWMC